MVISSISSGDLDKVWEIKTLKKEKDEEARRLLEMAAKQVQPIMRKRKWQVKLLSEFCPSNPGLLGLNIDGGREVRIRLRYHGREWDFYPYESILGTLLHELTHNEHGPHDAKFYKLLDEITKECEELMAKGISGTGQGFDALGQRLGGYTHNPPPTNLRAIAAAAAEKRFQKGSLMPSGPCRLGGDSEIMRALSPSQAAAMAAERRQRDDLWCAAPTTSGNDGVEKAKERENSSGQSSSELKSKGNDGAGPSSRNGGASTSEKGGMGGGFQSGPVKRDNNGSISNPIHDAALARAQKKGRNVTQSSSSNQGLRNNTSLESGEWTCSICTLHNPPLALACGACNTIREALPVESSTPAAKTWTCKFCTLENLDLVDNCEACGQWRYSYGAPAASRALMWAHDPLGFFCIIVFNSNFCNFFASRMFLPLQAWKD